MPFLRLTFALLVSLLLAAKLPAQAHRAPVHRGLGIPGPEVGSFVIHWEKVLGAIGYEFVLTDNQYCQAGCAGDTRQRFVSDTFAIEFDLAEKVSYYWITRVYYPNDSISPWSNISSFQALTPATKKLYHLEAAPTPGAVPLLRLDWQANPSAQQLVVRTLDLQGRQASARKVVSRRGPASRLEVVPLPLPPLEQGLLLLQVEVRDGRRQLLRTDAQKLWLRR
jgi:hypothetical protein